jgi:NAD-dependent deacetylase
MSDSPSIHELLEGSHRPIVLTGAGISVSSGLPTYRGAGGMWTDSPLSEAHSSPPPAKLSDPARRREWWDSVWALWGPIRSVVTSAEPSPAHKALARWQDSVEEMLVVTQNIDGLHQRAGSRAVVELHGNLLRTKCSRRRCSESVRPDATPHDVAPLCSHCGRPERPDVVLFTEGLDLHQWDRAPHFLKRADLLVVVGSSGAVTPASHLVTMAPPACALVRVDPGPWLGAQVGWTAEFKGTADQLFTDR